MNSHFFTTKGIKDHKRLSDSFFLYFTPDTVLFPLVPFVVIQIDLTVSRGNNCISSCFLQRLQNDIPGLAHFFFCNIQWR